MTNKIKQGSIEWLIEQTDIIESQYDNVDLYLSTYRVRIKEVRDQAKAMHKKEMIEFAEFLKGDFEFYGAAKEDEILWQLCGTEQRYTTEEVLGEFLTNEEFKSK